MNITVDRIENEMIVFITDNGDRFNVNRCVFPKLKEGDIIEARVMSDMTNSVKEQNKNRLQNLFDK